MESRLLGSQCRYRLLDLPPPDKAGYRSPNENEG